MHAMLGYNWVNRNFFDLPIGALFSRILWNIGLAAWNTARIVENVRFNLVQRKQIAQQRPDVGGFMHVNPLGMILLDMTVGAHVGIGVPIVVKQVIASTPSGLEQEFVKGAFAQNFDAEKHKVKNFEG